ncbi:allantoate deiminase [Trifolium repens]|nr:allantoate deiminase [Trifolium repens]
MNKYNPSTTNTNSQLNNNKFSSNNQFNTMGSPISPTWYHPKRPSFQPTNSHTKPNQPDEVPILMSGAGHDAMAMSRLTKVGMLFVRCRGGISHSPQEDVLDNDIWAASLATLSFLENL